MEIKETYICTKTLSMDADEKVSFTKGKEYIGEKKGSDVYFKNDYGLNHSVDNTKENGNWLKHFKLKTKPKLNTLLKKDLIKEIERLEVNIAEHKADNEFLQEKNDVQAGTISRINGELKELEADFIKRGDEIERLKAGTVLNLKVIETLEANAMDDDTEIGELKRQRSDIEDERNSALATLEAYRTVHRDNQNN